MTEDADALEGPELPSAKTVTALLRESRSLSRRADKLAAAAAAVPDPTTQRLSTETCATLEQLVHHLMLLERQLQRGENSPARHR